MTVDRERPTTERSGAERSERVSNVFLRSGDAAERVSIVSAVRITRTVKAKAQR